MCSGFVAPVITEVTTGCEASHETASSSSDRSCSAANSESFSTVASRSSESGGRRAIVPLRSMRLPTPSEPSRESWGGGSPRRYFPVRSPLASGKYGNIDTPLRERASSRSAGGRSRMLYCS